MVSVLTLLIFLVFVDHMVKMCTKIHTEAFFDPFVNITLLCHFLFTAYNPPTAALIFQRAVLAVLTFLPFQLVDTGEITGILDFDNFNKPFNVRNFWLIGAYLLLLIPLHLVIRLCKGSNRYLRKNTKITNYLNFFVYAQMSLMMGSYEHWSHGLYAILSFVVFAVYVFMVVGILVLAFFKKWFGLENRLKK